MINDFHLAAFGLGVAAVTAAGKLEIRVYSSEPGSARRAQNAGAQNACG